MKTLCGYMRVSGKGQVEGDGFPRQIEAIQSFVNSHWEYTDKLVLVREEGVSGTKDVLDRPSFANCLDKWHGGVEEIPYAVIVERLDRLARDLMVQECALRDLRKLGIKVFSCDHGFVDMVDETTDPSRVLIRQVFGAIAQYDKAVTVRKLACARKRIRDTGKKCEGRKFFGEVKECEKVARLRIIASRQAGISFRFIAGMLQEEGLRRDDGRLISEYTCQRVWVRFKEQRMKFERPKI